MPRRRAGVLLPLEEAILSLGLDRARTGDPDFYGFAVAESLGSGDRAAMLGHGTLYKALARLEQAGLLESHWEQIDTSTAGRPRRRLYRVTPIASGALTRSRAARAETEVRWAPA